MWLHGVSLQRGAFETDAFDPSVTGTEAEVDSQASRSSAIMLLLLGGFHAATDRPEYLHIYSRLVG